jgi:hypothetical protein
VLRASDQRLIEINPGTWLDHLPESPRGRETLQSAVDLGRAGIRRVDVVAGARVELLAVVPLAAMWGAGKNARRLPTYVKEALEEPEQTEAALLQLLSGISQGPREGFKRLWRSDDYRRGRIRGFGTSFGTKLLAFIDQARPERPTGVDAPLIYDLMVCRALAHLGACWPVEIETDGGPPTFDPADECVRFANYEAWCRLAARMAESANVDVADVEFSMFRLGQALGAQVPLPPSGCSGKLRLGSPADDLADEASGQGDVGDLEDLRAELRDCLDALDMHRP